MRADSTKRRIIDACVQLFAERGGRFTLDDIEEALHMSRKTVYRYFANKDDILKAIIDETGAEIHEKQRVIFDDETLAPREKLLAILTVETKYEHVIQVEQLYQLERYSPDVYRYFLEEYEKRWELVEALLRQGEADGLYRPCSVPLVVTLLQSGFQMLYRGDFFTRSGLTYKLALHEVASIIINGIDAHADAVR